MKQQNYGFTLIRDEFIEEYRTRALLYRHDKTGAELLSMINDDENKVFGITFRTPPEDSTGVAHILEHSVLCGSRKFPVKEPFVELLKGSLQTFLNAFTYPDKTCYPVASQNLKDFYNLVDIYMDAALHPLLKRHTHEQEAWHYELNTPDEPLIYKGVVFNEMKGVYASADALLAEHSQRVLYPDTTYGLDYGGDPRHIPDLTWEQLVAFHRRYYHPSNSRIYFYGDDKPEERLRLMAACLDEYDHQPVDSAIPLQPATCALPAKYKLPYPAGDEDAHLHLTVNWRLREGTDPEESMGLFLLDHILTETPASPVRKALIESGLGEDLAGVGTESQLREMYFSTGMKGVQPGDEDKVVALIEQTLAGLVKNGIDPKTIEASLNTEEFHFRELNTGGYPRGLALMIATLQTWLYDGDPLAPIRYQQPLASIRERLARGEKYFESLIQKWLIDNPHRTVLVLEPDRELKNRLDREETEKLAAHKSKLAPAELNAIIENTRELKRQQATPDKPEDLLCIPGLSRDDLDPQNKLLPIDAGTIGETPLLFHDLFTQGISYLDVGFDLRVVPDDLLSLAPVWAKAILETGTRDEDYVALTQRIGRLTGGIHPEFYASAMATTDAPGVAKLFLRGKAVDGKLGELLSIINDILAAPRLDLRNRIKQIIAEEKAGLESNIIPSGHRFVAQRLRARDHLHDWIQEQVSGISYLMALRNFMDQVDNDWPGLHKKLLQLHTLLTSSGNLLINLTADGATRGHAESLLKTFLENRGSGTPTAVRRDLFAKQTHNPEGLVIPAQVNYVGKSVNLHRHGERVSGHAMVVNRYLRSTYLWDHVRVQGGAYGGFSMIDPRSGQIAMVSYRDPNLDKTIATYDRAADYLKKLAIDEREVTRAIIGAIGDMDGYLLPDAKGYLSMGRHLTGDTNENRQRLRDEILATKLDHFHNFGELLGHFVRHGHIVVMGSDEHISSMKDVHKIPVL
jgi:Zn-dependent M16 (insulinase) family peptidase